jgi:hypothetical protein
MPLQYVGGNLLVSGADILTIPVNCVGVAGKGLALQCKQHYPEWFAFYQDACRSRLLFPGRSVLHLVQNRFFLSFPTKDHWRNPSQLNYIEKGLQELVACSGPWSVPERVLSMPQLGCGAGGLSWSQVQPVMEYYLSQLPCTVWIYV